MTRLSYRALGFLVCALLCACGGDGDRGHLAEAKRLAAEGKYADAVAVCNQILSGNSQHLEALLLLARLNLVQGHLAQAAQLAEQAMQLAPDHADTYLLLGDIYVRQRRNADAVLIYQEGLHTAPEQGDFYRKLAIGLCRRRALQRSHRDPPASPQTLRRRGHPLQFGSGL